MVLFSYISDNSNNVRRRSFLKTSLSQNIEVLLEIKLSDGLAVGSSEDFQVAVYAVKSISEIEKPAVVTINYSVNRSF